jgi:hypothetical protein
MKKIVVEFYYKTRGYQVFEVPMDYDIDESNTEEAYNNLIDLIGHNDGCIKCNPITPEDFGFGLGIFSHFGDFLELFPNDTVQIVDFEFNKLMLEEEAELYEEDLDEDL